MAISLISYHPGDPSINNATDNAAVVKNAFGTVGAHTSGFLIALFGLGAFWIPIIILLITVQILKGYPYTMSIVTSVAGLALMVTTGSLLSLYHSNYPVWGREISAGGILGVSISRVSTKYFNPAGGAIVLLTVWLMALIITTRLSLASLLGWIGGRVQHSYQRLKRVITIRKERGNKARRRMAAGQRLEPEQNKNLKIKEPSGLQVQDGPLMTQEVFEFMNVKEGFRLPPLSLLDDPDRSSISTNHESLRMQSRLLEKKLNDFNVSGRVVSVSPGPVITTFEYEPAPGVKINRIMNLADDLAMALRATSIRVVAPIPGKAVIGIEVSNPEREMVRIKDIIASSEFMQTTSKLTLALGKDVVGNPVVTDLGKMPHLLIAGATGTGKSVALNSMICSILYKSTPFDVNLLIIDPKRIELSIYEGIPHLITPVVTEAKKATYALQWAVREMEQRYAIMAEKGVRNIHQYNKKREDRKEVDPWEKLPFIVIVIDELSDLMMVASRDVEMAMTRLAQMARAAGIHLLIATQRPSVDVLTGVIKANFPTRISFQVSSKTDSRTILDANGAENLLGNGDMLFLTPGTAKLQRIHGAYISEIEIHRIIEFLKRQRQPEYRQDILKPDPEDKGTKPEEEEYDEKYDEAVELVTKTRQASISMLQRRLRVGYNRAARMIEMMEREGVVGPSDGVKPRQVLVKGYNDD